MRFGIAEGPPLSTFLCLLIFVCADDKAGKASRSTSEVRMFLPPEVYAKSRTRILSRLIIHMFETVSVTSPGSAARDNHLLMFYRSSYACYICTPFFRSLFQVFCDFWDMLVNLHLIVVDNFTPQRLFVIITPMSSSKATLGSLAPDTERLVDNLA